MDPVMLGIVALRSIGTLFRLQGAPQIQTTINTVLSAYNAGRNVDKYLQEIADNLEAGGDLASWDDIQKRINAEVDAFLEDKSPAPAQAEGPGGGGEET